MIKVIIKEKYSTSFGNIIQVELIDGIKVGDDVLGDDGNIYKVKRIIMPSKPEEYSMGLVC